MGQKFSTFEKRRQRVRTSLRARAGRRPRLSIHRSGRHIYAQIIDDSNGTTLCAASSREASFAANKVTKVEKAAIVGKAIAARAIEAGVKAVVFDRGGNLYHGRVKSLAEGAREGGLEF